MKTTIALLCILLTACAVSPSRYQSAANNASAYEVQEAAHWCRIGLRATNDVERSMDECMRAKGWRVNGAAPT